QGEDALDLRGNNARERALADPGDERVDEVTTGDHRAGREEAEPLDIACEEPDLLAELAERGGPQIGIGRLRLAAWETTLARVILEVGAAQDEERCRLGGERDRYDDAGRLGRALVDVAIVAACPIAMGEGRADPIEGQACHRRHECSRAYATGSTT